jgi:hypothetical protein
VKNHQKIISEKLELAELATELGVITREKWKRFATMEDILKREECLIREIATKTELLEKDMEEK